MSLEAKDHTPFEAFCKRGPLALGIYDGVYGQRRFRCRNWTCGYCGPMQREKYLRPLREALAWGDTLYYVVTPDMDTHEGQRLRNLVNHRAATASKKGQEAERLNISRPGESLVIATANLGSGRKAPTAGDFREISTPEQLDELAEYWFRTENLDSGLGRGRSELRCSTSRGWQCGGSATEGNPFWTDVALLLDNEDETRQLVEEDLEERIEAAGGYDQLSTTALEKHRAMVKHLEAAIEYVGAWGRDIVVLGKTPAEHELSLQL